MIPDLAQGFKDLAFFRELWHKVSDVARIPPLLWLWLRLADAAPIQHQAWARARAGGGGEAGREANLLRTTKVQLGNRK